MINFNPCFTTSSTCLHFWKWRKDLNFHLQAPKACVFSIRPRHLTKERERILLWFIDKPWLYISFNFQSIAKTLWTFLSKLHKFLTFWTKTINSHLDQKYVIYTRILGKNTYFRAFGAHKVPFFALLVEYCSLGS